MKFQTIPVQVTGPTYQTRSRPLSSQSSINWYPKSLPLAKDEFVLMPFPGAKFNKSFGSVQGGFDRGFQYIGDSVFVVNRNTLYEFSGDDISVRGGVNSIAGTDRCILAGDGENVFIVSNTGVYWYNGSVIQVLTDPNIVGSVSVDFINNQFIYTKPNFTSISNVGDGTTVNPLNVIGEETDPDSLVRDFVYDEIIYRFGTRSTVAWYNSGVGNPPIEKLQGRIFQVGLGAIHSVARTDEAMYWLGDDYRVYRTSAGSKQTVSTEPLSAEFASYAKQSVDMVKDAQGSTITMDGNNFYILTFPTANKTFILNESLGPLGWSQISSEPEQGRYLGSSYFYYDGKQYLTHFDNGGLFVLDFDWYYNGGIDVMRRERITNSVNGDLLGAKGKRVQMSKAKFIMETGVGLMANTIGGGENPRIMIEHSDDGGRTWKHGAWPKVGRLGEFTLQVEYYNLGTFFDRIFRISTSDPVSYTIYSATIDLRRSSSL